jgi:hypothetical protein
MPSTAAAGYQDLLEAKLISAVSTSTTVGVTVKVKMINGVTPTWTTIAHRVKVIQRTATTTKAEVWQVAAGTTQSGQTVTLGTLTRALPLSNGTDFTGSGTAQAFAAGADVFLAWDAHDAAMTPKLDINNTFTGTNTFSGAMVTTGSQKVPVYADAAARDAAITVPANGMEVYLTSEGQFTDYVAGAWADRASGTNPNASTTEAGKVEEATASEIGSATASGATGARLFINPSSTAKTSSGAGDENKLPVLDSSGNLVTGFLPNIPVSKFNSGTNASSTTFWRGDGVWASSSPLRYQSTDDSNDIASGAAIADYDNFYTIPANDLSSGVTYVISAQGTYNGGTLQRWPQLYVRLGSTTLLTLDTSANPTASTAFTWFLEATVVCTAAGAGSTSLRCTGKMCWQFTTTAIIFDFDHATTGSLNSTTTNDLKLSALWNGNDGTGKSSIMKTLTILRYS